ncbi:MAG: WbuC family cupin fold metalloprotein [Burkholderiaceae bacterium]
MKANQTADGLIEVDGPALEQLNRGAATSARRRDHLLLHDAHADAVQRILMSMMAGTYVAPHCHHRQRETLIALFGHCTVLIFDDRGRLQRRVPMRPAADMTPGCCILELPVHTWHSVIVPGGEQCTLFEVKPGPYLADETEFAPWAPREGDASVPAMLEALAVLAPGQRIP